MPLLHLYLRFLWCRACVQTIRIPVVVERVCGRLYVVVGREKHAEDRVIYSAVHVYETELIEMLMSGVTSVCCTYSLLRRRGYLIRPSTCISPASPRIIRVPLYYVAYLVCHCNNQSKVVGVEIAHSPEGEPNSIINILSFANIEKTCAIFFFFYGISNIKKIIQRISFVNRKTNVFFVKIA